MRQAIPRILLAAAWCLCTISASRAGDAASAAALVPAEVDLFVAVDDAAAWRTGPGGDLLEQGAHFLAQQDDLPRAWAALARTLGLEGPHAFDELLGRRAIFVQRYAKAQGKPPSWALIAAVSPETERLIRERLKPAPRLVQQGVRVLALEDGRFWLASAAAKDSSMILLAASDAPALFDEILPTLGRSTKSSLAASKYGEDLRAIQPGAHAVLLARRRDTQGRLAIIGLAAKREAMGCSVGVLIRSEALAERLAQINPTAAFPLDRLDENALFIECGWRVPGFYDALGISGADAFLPVFLKNFEGNQWLGPRTALALWRQPDRTPRAAVALEATDLESLAPAADRFIAGMFKGAAVNSNERWPDDSILDLKGEFLDAPREFDPKDTPLAADGSPWPAGVPFSWSFVSEHQEPPSAGWWAIATGAPALERLREALIAPPEHPQQPKPVLSAGLVRPAQLWDSLESAGLPIALLPPQAADTAQRLDRITWSLQRGDGGSLRGSATVRFIENAPPR